MINFANMHLTVTESGSGISTPSRAEMFQLMATKALRS